MAAQPTADEVVQAARDLAQSEFTRDDIAGKLGLKRKQMKEGFREARKSGQIEKASEGEDDGPATFRLASPSQSES